MNVCCASAFFYNLLPDDVLHTIVLFTGKKCYYPVGHLNKRSNNIFELFKIPKKSYVYHFAPHKEIRESTPFKNPNFFLKSLSSSTTTKSSSSSSPVLDWCLHEKNEKRLDLICSFAIRQNNVDILRKVFDFLTPSSCCVDDENNIEIKKNEQKAIIRRYLLNKRNKPELKYTVIHGHLETIKWFLSLSELETESEDCLRRLKLKEFEFNSTKRAARDNMHDDMVQFMEENRKRVCIRR
eukprot:CAMPEP_0178953732 /NCGR_PEP_ID=MMETSP0789-20121207/8584_1 /TAXON_ID=3005 /ORGANISM="Rhizosolenia setigera, Strain CCMP 1694" /LENGTH=238 /DNA_ID=CAMNT_0020635027 /DNA_START=194 /DNA_END=910 /DNA_ORIENTATION=-